MFLFFEEDGAFKVGTVLTSTESTCQVELVSGKRIKIKKNHVFLEFTAPTPKEFLELSQATSETVDVDLLWECAPKEEFNFKEAAKEYFGDNASLIEKSATLLCLHAHPAYFYRKGRGNYRSAPAETLKLALAAIERKRLLEQKKDSFVRMMIEDNIAPDEIRFAAIALLAKPDKNSVEWKALQEASAQRSCSPLRLLLELKAIPNAWHYHADSFFMVNFPNGRAFSDTLPKPDLTLHESLPLSDVVAFSIDDSSTTEIDDALSVVPVGDNRTRVGIHISVPALGIATDSPVDKVVRQRMSTVYAPGLKTTMLPEDWIKAYSLDEGKVCPAMSLYAIVDNETFDVVATETKLERIKIGVNLWYDKIEALVSESAIQEGTMDVPFAKELGWLWHFSKHLLRKREETRGWPEAVGKIDWYFDLQGEDENARIQLKGRKRGEPLDLLVAEMMIFANATWGEYLDKKNVAGIYRSQRMGKVKLTSVPGPHDGLGVEYYAWSTSPLRRYVDLVNQRQLIAAIEDTDPPYRSNDVELYTVIGAFDSNYALFNEFQTRMDRYWSLRWINQEGIKEIKAIVVKGDLVRFDGLPMMQKVPGLPEFERGQNILMEVVNLDYIELVLELKLLEILDITELADDADDELVEQEEQKPEVSDKQETKQEEQNQ